MGGVVYGTVAVPASPPAPPPSLRMVWTGWDGSEWVISDWSLGVFVTDGGIQGLGAPAYTHYTQEAPGIAGQWYRGSNAKARKVFWPLAIWSDPEDENWAAVDTAFWRTMDPERGGVWSVWGPSGEKRSLACRFEDDGGHAYAADPVQTGWEVYGLTLTADQPFWVGDPETRSWKSDTPVDFLPASAGDTYHISSGSTLATAAITNAGDVDAWPVWTVIGESSTASVGIGSAQISVPFEVASGKALVIDTDPTVQTATLYDYTAPVGSTPEVFANPVDRTADLGTVSFAPIPAGTDVALNVSMTGGGYLRASVTPRYRKAW
ncbi:MAG: hypothetical protein ACTHKE_04375 [Sphingomicrobium sp.]